MKGRRSPIPCARAADVDRLRDFDSRESLGHVLETIRLLRTELASRVPLIGFGGAPFTLAAYAIEGGPSSNYARTKAFMYAEPDAWHRLCGRFASMMIEYLRAQVEAGAQAMQIFDSWAGALGRADYREFALPHTRRIFDELTDVGVPTIHFGVGTTAILPDLAAAGGDVIGVDWRQPLDDAWETIGFDRGIQGNLDPCLLLGRRSVCSPEPTTCCSGPAAGPVTSSISATASCRTRRSNTSSGSPGTCTQLRAGSRRMN